MELLLQRSKFEYCSHFCEENAYKIAFKLQLNRDSLCRNIDSESIDEYQAEQISRFCAGYCHVYAVFISSRTCQVPIWYQTASASYESDTPVVWDYHVILVIKTTTSNDSLDELSSPSRSVLQEQKESSQRKVYVLDLDTRLEFPLDAIEYFRKSFRPEIEIQKDFAQTFRVIPANDYISHFASDRSHMRESGMPFPTWPCIRGEHADCDMNLFQYITMHDKKGHIDRSERHGFGTVMNREEFGRWCDS
jgi:N-terminal glutamine amidase